MVYKKFITKGGKVYGPYTYHSKRVGDKVISEYHGKDDDMNAGAQVAKSNPDHIFISIIVMLALLLVVDSLHGAITGNVILRAETSYVANESLDGILRLNLREGEFIPASTKVVLENGGKSYEYTLEDLIPESEFKGEGNFFVDGKSVSGSGTGYGVKGKKEIPADVEFTLNILSRSSVVEEEKTPTTESGESSETPETNPEATPGEASETSKTTPEETPSETTEGEQTPAETNTESTGENTQTTPEIPAAAEESPGITGTATNNGEIPETTPEETPESSEGEQAPTETSESSSSESSDSGETASESSSESSSESPSESSSESPSESPVTGSVIAGFFSRVSNFFLGIARTTGFVALDVESEVSGKTSQIEPFTYQLSPSLSADIKSGSVKTLEGEVLDDDKVELDIVDNVVTVSSQYFISEEGYGEEYLGNNVEQFVVNLSALDIIPQKGDLSIKLVYNEEEVVSLTTVLDIESLFVVSQNQTISEKADVLKASLTQEEFDRLVSEFGENISVNTSEAKVIGNRLVLKFVLGKYWSEKSYDYSGNELSNQVENQIVEDRIKFLKDLSRTLMSKDEGTLNVTVDNLTGEFEIFEGNVVGVEPVIPTVESNQSNDEVTSPVGESVEVGNESVQQENETSSEINSPVNETIFTQGNESSNNTVSAEAGEQPVENVSNVTA